MAEEFTADDFPDKGEFIPPTAKRKKPDCDRKTLIPDPCDLRVDRRKKTEENNDCLETPIVQVCPENIGNFKIPTLPPPPPVFKPKIPPPVRVLPDPEPPIEDFCNEEVRGTCPGNGQDPLRLYGPEIIVESGAFCASTQEEADALALAHLEALQENLCEYANDRLILTCDDLQNTALEIGGIGYTEANTTIEVVGDGVGAIVDPVIQNGRVTDFTIVNAGVDYNALSLRLEGDGIGAAVGRVVIDDYTGELLEVHLGQVLPDPDYNPVIDPAIYCSTCSVTVRADTFTSIVSKDEAIRLAKEAGFSALDCMYQSPPMERLCPPNTIPQPGFELPLGTFKIPIRTDTQESVTSKAESILEGFNCVEICCPNGFPEVEVDLTMYNPTKACDGPGGGPGGVIGSSDLDITVNFDCEECVFTVEGEIPLPEIPCPCGFDMDISGGSMTVSTPPQKICPANVEANITSCLSSNRSELDGEAWLFDEEPNPPICSLDGQEIPFDIAPFPALGNTDRSDKFTIGDPDCGGPNQPPCDDRIEGGGCQTPVEAGTGNLPDNNGGFNVKVVKQADFDISTGGILNFLPPPVVGDEKVYFYYSDVNPIGMVGELHITTKAFCEFPEGILSDNCNACISPGGEDGSSGSPSGFFDIDNCKLTLELPDYSIALPEIPCPCGFETTSNIGGMHVSVSDSGLGLNSDIAVDNCAGVLDLGVSLESDGNINAELTFDPDECTFDLELTLPNLALEVPCPQVAVSVSGGELSVTECEGPFSFEVEQTPPCVTEDGCAIDIVLPDINLDLCIPCPDGIGASGEITTTGTVDVCGGIVTINDKQLAPPESTVTFSSDVRLTVDNCNVELDGGIVIDGCIDLPDIDISIPPIPCPNGMSVEGGIESISDICIEGGNVIVNDEDKGSPSSDLKLITDVSINIDDCNIILGGNIGFEGCIDLPDIDIDIPCPDGITAEGSIGIGYGNEFDSTVSITFLQDPDCLIKIDGDLTIPEIEIPNIPCPDGFDVSISGGCLEVVIPPGCEDELTNVNIDTRECLSEGRANLEQEGWDFKGPVTPENKAPKGLNPFICIAVDEPIEFEIPPYPATPGMDLSDRMAIGDPDCGGPGQDPCDDRIDGGGELTPVKAGEGNLPDEPSNVIKLAESLFTIGEGGSFTFTPPTADITYPKTYYYYSTENDVGMVGEIQVTEDGKCDVPGGLAAACGDCVTNEDEGVSSGPSANYDSESCSFDITLPDYKIEFPEIPCPCGFETSGGIGIEYGGGFDSTVEITIDDCNIGLSGNLVIPEINIPCPDGFDVNISGGCLEVVIPPGCEDELVNVNIDTRECLSGGRAKPDQEGWDFKGPVGEDEEAPKGLNPFICAGTDEPISFEIPAYPATPGMDLSDHMAIGDPDCGGDGQDPCDDRIDGGGELTLVKAGSGKLSNDPSNVKKLIQSPFTIGVGGSFTFTPPTDVTYPKTYYYYSTKNDVGMVGEIQITEDGKCDVPGGLAAACGDCITNEDAGVSSGPSASYNSESCSFDITLPDYKIEFPEIPCPCGFETSGGIGIEYGDAFGSTVEITIDDCNIGLSGNLVIPEINIPCPDGMSADSSGFYVSGGNVTVNGEVQDSPHSTVNLVVDDCNIVLDGCIMLPDIEIPDIPCPDGMSTSGSIGIEYGDSFDSTVSIEVDDCSITLGGNLVIPDPFAINIPCEDGFSVEGSMGIEYGDDFDSTVELSIDDCNITLGGNLIIPSPNINIPCPDGMTAGGGICILGGSVTVGNADPVSPTSAVNITVDECNIVLDGCIELPDVVIPDIPCPDGISTSGSIGIEYGHEFDSTVEITTDGCDIVLGGSLVIPEIDIANINIPCPNAEGSIGIEYGDDFDSTVELTVDDNCNITLDGNLTIPLPNIPCPNAEGSIGIEYGDDFDSTVELKVDDNCNITLGGSLVIPDPFSINVPCADGFSVEGSMGIEYGDDFDSTVELSIDECNITLNGNLVIPSPNINIPCPDGMSAEGEICLIGGTVTTGNTNVVSPNSNVSITVDECNIVLDGCIELPDVVIPDIEVGTSSTIGIMYGGAFASDVKLSTAGHEVSLTGNLTIPDPNVVIPNITCIDGYTTTPSISITAGDGYVGDPEANFELSFNNDTCALDGTIAITLPSVDGPNINVDIPDVEAAGTIAIEYGSGFSSDVSLSATGHDVTLGGTLTIPDPAAINIPCEDGFSIEGSMGIEYGDDFDSTVEVLIDDCNITLGGNLIIPSPNIEFPDVEADGTISIEYGDAFTSDVSLSATGHAVRIAGNLTIPEPNVVIPNIPDVEADGTISIEYGDAFTSDVSLSATGHDVTLSGTLTIPEPDLSNINCECPEITCSEASGYLCSADYTEQTLTVCETGGSTTTITVLVKN